MEGMMQVFNREKRSREEQPVKMAIFGRPGIGKTSLLKTISEETICLDLEAGMLSVQDWEGDSLRIRRWEDARHAACLLGGYNPGVEPSATYSQRHYGILKEKFPQIDEEKYSCIFIDSITIASKLCLGWCKKQPQALNKSGAYDRWGAYALLASEMEAWINIWQHSRKNVIMVGILEKDTNGYYMAMEGQKTETILPAVFDEVLCMVGNKTEEGLDRQFVCGALNEEGLPAKDRSGKLRMIEKANLDYVLNKIRSK
jgi:hypothetical protein